MDNYINQRLSPSYGFFEIMRRKPAEASNMLVANISNSAEAHGHPAMQEKTSVTAETSQNPEAKVIKQNSEQSADPALSASNMRSSPALPACHAEIEQGYITPEERINARPVTPLTPRAEDRKISTGDNVLKSKKRLFPSHSSSEKTSGVSDSLQGITASKKTLI